MLRGENRGVNYQKELDKVLNELAHELAQGGAKRLLLHSCCAPCSSYCLEYLRQFFRITVFYYNPNITEHKEYNLRMEEEKRLIAEYNKLPPTCGYQIDIIEGEYDREEFFAVTKGLEACPEGGDRCFQCYKLRLRKTAKLAAGMGFDYFTTTLTISPLKNAEKLNEIGYQMQLEESVFGKTKWLPSDFKKKNGYKRSIELSKQYGLYRQNYCGCGYSKVNSKSEK